jgi:AcrR family transcriptional regulator
MGATYRNSIRTKRMIREAFAELVAEKQDIAKISVKELVERADISKSTFYCHYQDIYAVIEEFEQEILSLLDDTLNTYMKDHQEEFAPYIGRIIQHLKENENLYKKIIVSDLPNQFIDKLKNICIERVNKDVHLNAISKDPKIRVVEIDFFTNGIIHLFVDYFKGEIDLSLDEIGNLSNKLLYKLAKEEPEV